VVIYFMRFARGNILKQTLESMMDNPETHTRLEIQNGQLETVNRRRADNAMAKGQKDKQ